MGGEKGRHKEPTFSEEDIDTFESEEARAEVDLDQLLSEIDLSMSASPTATTSTSPPHEAIGDLEETFTSEAPVSEGAGQSSLDFGENTPFDDAVHQDESTDLPQYNQKGEEPMSRGVVIAGGALVALGLLTGVAGLVTAFSASGRIEALQQSVDALQNKLATLQVSGDPRVGQLQAEQAGLASRLDEATAKLEELAAAPAKGSNDSSMADLRKRLDALEHKSAQPARTTTATPPKTITKTATKTPASKPSAKGEWNVILVSFTTAAQADGERARLQKLGVHAEVIKSQVDGKNWYRVSVPGYSTQESAKAAIPGLENKTGIKGAWAAHS